jgi:hypothetical protein
LLKEFESRRGYKLEDKLRELLGMVDDGNQVLSDYRETLSDMLLENFSQQWTEWAHSHGVLTRNQAHGSPANLIDVYASVDVPEIEGFGLSEFGIKGLRTDKGYTRKNDSDVSMLKYAASAAHVTGKNLVSSETFTWLTEHFRTSLSQMKPDLDLMFTCGVNHVFFHGTAYSPKEDAWPGWKFYASVDMSPTNSIWRDAPELMKYIERSQSFLQMGKPDNDFLVYLPVRDMWRQRLKEGTEGLLMQFDIHSMAKKAPDFIQSIIKIDKLGYDCDYVSDRLLMSTKYEGGMLVTAGGTKYKALIIPSGKNMPKELKSHLESLKAKGAKIIEGVDEGKMKAATEPEKMKAELGLRIIRRSNETGHHYFVANLTPNDIKMERVKLSVGDKTAEWYDPMTGKIYAADINNEGLLVSLRSGESMILRTYNNGYTSKMPQLWQYTKEKSISVGGNKKSEVKTVEARFDISEQKWALDLKSEEKGYETNKHYELDKIRTWEGLDETARDFVGTGVYTAKVNIDELCGKMWKKGKWTIELGDVRESARVYINGKYAGCAWAVPFSLDITGMLKKGENEIRIEVTNLPANRIAKLDREGVKWRKMKEINVVDINYKKTTYAGWAPVESGLNSKVELIRK